MRNRLINTTLIAIAYLITCVAVFTGEYFQSALTVNVGEVSMQRVVATRDVENTVATENNRAAAQANAENAPTDAAEVWDPSLNIQTLNNIYAFFDQLDGIRLAYDLWLIERMEAEDLAYARWQEQVFLWEVNLNTIGPHQEEAANIMAPVRPDEEFTFEFPEFPMAEQFESLPAALDGTQMFLLTLPEAEYNDLYYALLETAEAVLASPGISDTSTPQVEADVHAKLLELMYHYDAIHAGGAIVMGALAPNRMFNEELFRVIQQEIAESYETVMLLQNQVIVDEGEIIGVEAYAIMHELGMLETEWTRDLVPLAGIAVIVAITMLTCCWFIFFYRRRIISRIKEAMLLFTLYSFVMLVLWALDGVGFYFMPILVFTMLIAMLMDSRTAAILNLGFTIIAYFVIDGTMHYMLFFVLSGSLICLLARYTTERNKIMMVSLLTACFNFILIVAIYLAFEPHQAAYSLNDIAITGVIAALNGVLTVIIAVGSLPLWEVVFGVVTPIKILDLTNPTNPLMRRLTIEAPGTYHHSLIVANLAESASYDIGANPHIARAGGYYHDIGKLKYPQYFAENITGVSPHDSMEPEESAKTIMSHIEFGMELAAQYRLPQFLRDIIHEHHATSIIKYFYSKAREKEDPDIPATKIDENNYRYPYSIPQSRESAIVMLADGVEASVRSMMAQGTDIKDVQGMIDKMIKGKLTDGSLADSKLSIKDVDTISRSFYRVLKGMYHERIPYPKDIAGEAEVEVAITRR